MDAFIFYSAISLVAYVLLHSLYEFVRLIQPRLKIRSPAGYLEGLAAQGNRLFANPYTQVTLFFTANRLIILLIATSAYSLLEGVPLDVWGTFDDIWYKWDTRHYLYIAEHGYPASGEYATIIVYYPLFPLLIKFVHFFIGDYFLAAVAVSTLCLWLSCLVFFKLCVYEFGSQDIGRGAVKYLLLFPLSYFGSMAYTESTFLLFSLCSFYFIRRGFWFWAGFFGLCAALTRNQGVILLAPMVYEIIRQSLESSRNGEKWSTSQFVKSGLSSLLIPLGFVFYLGVNWYVSGDWFSFLTHQRENWAQQFMFFAENLVNIFGRLQESDMNIVIGTWLPSILMFVFALLLITLSTVVLPNGYVIYSVAFLVISYSPSWLLSGARYMFVLFPLYMVLAKISVTRPTFSKSMDFALSCSLVLSLFAFIRFGVY